MDRAAARETSIPTQAGRISGSTLTKNKKKWRIWAGICFAIVLLGTFTQPLLALINYAARSDLYSYRLFLLICFTSGVINCRKITLSMFPLRSRFWLPVSPLWHSLAGWTSLGNRQQVMLASYS